VFPIIKINHFNSLSKTNKGIPKVRFFKRKRRSIPSLMYWNDFERIELNRFDRDCLRKIREKNQFESLQFFQSFYAFHQRLNGIITNLRRAIWLSEKLKIWNLPIKYQIQTFQVWHFFKGFLKSREIYFWPKKEFGFFMSSFFFYIPKSIFKTFKDPKLLKISVSPLFWITQLRETFLFWSNEKNLLFQR